MRSNGIPHVVGHVAVAARYCVRQPKSGGLGRLEAGVPRLRVPERVQILLGCPVAPCQGAVTGRSVLALVQDGHADGQ